MESIIFVDITLRNFSLLNTLCISSKDTLTISSISNSIAPITSSRAAVHILTQISSIIGGTTSLTVFQCYLPHFCVVLCGSATVVVSCWVVKVIVSWYFAFFHIGTGAIIRRIGISRCHLFHLVLFNRGAALWDSPQSFVNLKYDPAA